MIKKMDQKEAITKLKELLKPKDTVYCILTKLSNSGCYRHINFYKFYSTKKLDKINAIEHNTIICFFIN